MLKEEIKLLKTQLEHTGDSKQEGELLSIELNKLKMHSSENEEKLNSNINNLKKELKEKEDLLLDNNMNIELLKKQLNQSNINIDSLNNQVKTQQELVQHNEKLKESELELNKVSDEEIKKD